MSNRFFKTASLICVLVLLAHEALEVVASLISIGQAVFGVGLVFFVYSALWGTTAPYVWSVAAMLGVLGIGLHRTEKTYNRAVTRGGVLS